MKVIYDGVIFEKQLIGGISRVFSELINRVANEPDFEVGVVTTRKWKSEFDFSASQAQEVRLPDPRRFVRPNKLFGRYHKRIDRMLRSLYGAARYDLWHSTEYTAPAINMPSVVTIHDMIPELFPEYVPGGYVSYATKAKKKAIYEADAVIAVSGNTKNDILACYPNLPDDKIRVVHNAYDKNIFSPRNTPVEKYLLYVGGRSEYKGFGVLRDCLNEWEPMTEYYLLSVGREMTDRELSDCNFRVKSVSNISDSELAGLYSSASAFIYPSFYEGFGIPILEALACHCPVVASDIPTSREIAGSAPYYFNPGEKRELARAIESAVQGLEWNERLNRAEDVLSRYSWESSARQTVDVYKSVVE